MARRHTGKASDKNRLSTTADTVFAPFEVVDMGDGKVGINEGVLVHGMTSTAYNKCNFVGSAVPQNLLGRDLDTSKFLDVKENEYVCIRVKDNPSSRPQVEIVALTKESLSEDENKRRENKIIKLAHIKSIEDKEVGEGGTAKFIEIDYLYAGHLVAEIENWPPFTPIIWPEEEASSGSEEGEGDPQGGNTGCDPQDTDAESEGDDKGKVWKAIFVPGSIYIPHTMDEPRVVQIDGKSMLDFPIVEVSAGEQWSLTYEIDKEWALKGDPVFGTSSTSTGSVTEVIPSPPEEGKNGSCDPQDGSFRLNVLSFVESGDNGVEARQSWRSDLCIYGFKRCNEEESSSDSGGGFDHPWKVTANGDDTVSVAAGKVLSYDNESVSAAGDLPVFIHLKEFFDYAGGNITVTGAGKIYASMPYEEGPTASLFDLDPGSGNEDGYTAPLVPESTGTLTVDFISALPVTGQIMAFEIADVSLDGGGNAVVDSQIITHNPQMVAWTSSGPGSP